MKVFNQLRVAAIILFLLGIWLSYDAPENLEQLNTPIANKALTEMEEAGFTYFSENSINVIGCYQDY